MSYLSLYRKYRSQTFSDLAGQDHVTRTLQNAVRSGRIAHAYLLCGPRGTGKTSTARLLAKALNCQSEDGPAPEPCNQCDACVQITQGRFLDVIEIDAATNRGIDEIRSLRETVIYKPAQGRFKVYVIDEAHQITGEGFNALLKTLEEPPSHVVFVLATTELHRIPATILSRCQPFEFRRASLDQLRERVRWVAEQEGFQTEDRAIDLIAREANGGWRDALSLLEQVLAYCSEKITALDVYAVLGTVQSETLIELVDSARTGNGAALWEKVETLVAEGKDPRQLLRDLSNHVRQLLLSASGAPPLGAEPELLRQAKECGLQFPVTSLEVLASAEREARWSEQPRMLLELALARMMLAAQAPTVSRPAPNTTQLSPVPSRPAPTARPSATPTAAPPPNPSTPTVPAPARPTPTRAETPAAPQVAPEKPVLGDARAGRDDDLDWDDVPLPEAPPEEPRWRTEPDSTPIVRQTRSTPPPRSGGTPPPTSGRNTSPPRTHATPPARSTNTGPAPETTAMAASGGNADGQFRVIKGRWRSILEELKRAKRVMVQVTLAEAEPERMEGHQLVIRFPRAHLLKAFNDRQFSGQLAEAVKAVTGIDCRPVGEAAGESTGPTASSAVPAAGAAPALISTPEAATARTPAPSSEPQTGDPLVHTVVDLFEGRVLDLEE